MAWTDLSGAFGFGTKLTSAQMQQLRDNITALANGDSGAPRIVNAAVDSATLSYDKLEYHAGNVQQQGAGTSSAYYEVLGADGTWRQCCPTYDDTATCFPAGSMVLMANGYWKPIELIQAGELLYSVDGPAKVKVPYITRLGSRKMYRMGDNSLQWSEEHAFFVKRSERPYIWTMSKKHLIKEAEDGVIGGLRDFGRIYEGEELEPEKFAFFYGSLTEKGRGWKSGQGWKDNHAVEIPEYRGRHELPLYLPITENGELIIVNGYLVGAALDEFKCDYENLNWAK